MSLVTLLIQNRKKEEKKKRKKGTVYNYNKGIRNVLQFLMRSSN